MLIVSVAFHEAAHARVALAFGDRTAAEQGRVTLNPIRHLDPLMSVFLPLALLLSTKGAIVFGGAKPVPVNVARLHPPSSAILVAAAGPATNVVLGLLFGLAWALCLRTEIFQFDDRGARVLQAATGMNFFLAAFNLVPVPPLDGSRVLAGLLPGSVGRIYARLEPFAFLALLALVVAGAFSWVYDATAGPAQERWLEFLGRTVVRGG